MTVPITDAVDAVLFTADDLAAAARALRTTYRPWPGRQHTSDRRYRPAATPCTGPHPREDNTMSTTRNARGLRVTVRTACARHLAHRLLTVGRNPRTGQTAIRLAIPDRLKTAS